MTTSASEIFDLRNFYFYQCGNIFTGSLNNFNYKIIPDKENLTVLVWHGRLCSDLAEIETEKKYPLTQEGFDEMIKWLENEYKKDEQQLICKVFIKPDTFSERIRLFFLHYSA